MRLAAWIVFAGVGLMATPALGAPGAAAPVVGGTPTSDYPEVVALRSPLGPVFCTGTVIAPHVVLTAAHCLGETRTPAIELAAQPGPTVPAIRAVAAIAHPEHDPTTLDHDLALLVTAAALPVAPAAPLDAPPPGGLVGATVTLVGYGLTAVGDTTPAERRVAQTPILEVDANSFRFGPTPAQTCAGDSGGPAFIDVAGGRRLAGVTSSGDAACAAFAIDMRVDYYVAAFLAPWLDRLHPGAAPAGARCYYEGHCGAGACATPADGGFAYCAASCGGGAACPDGQRCAAGTCQFDGPSPGAFGARCGDDADCVSEVCATAPGATTGTCSAECYPDGLACEVGACAAIDADTYRCFPADDGGCGVGRRPAAPVGVLVVALARRRRRDRAAPRRR